MPTVTLLHGDCREVLRTLPDNSVDAVVTDPPYGLEFMGKEWDAPWKQGFADFGLTGHRRAAPVFGSKRNFVCRTCHKHQRGSDSCQCQSPDYYEKRVDYSRAFGAWCETWATEVLRVLKPGGHLLAFGGTRTQHRMVCAIEDAGFEVRDTIMWVYGSGFPKSARPNRGQAFCQCGELVRSGGNRGPALSPDGHTDTEAASGGGDLPAPDALHLSRTGEGSLADCRREDDSHDGRALGGQESAPVSPPSQGYAPARSRSCGRGDETKGAPSHSPSAALCSDHPSSPGSYPLSALDASPSNLASNTLAGIGESGHHTPDIRQESSLNATPVTHYSNGFPCCLVCGKPNADGWGTALKPALEPICLARKPLSEGTVAANVLRWGTGAINVDGCRVGIRDESAMYVQPRPTTDAGGVSWRKGEHVPFHYGTSGGRFPANLIHDGSAEVLECFPQTAPSTPQARHNAEYQGPSKGRDLPHTSYGHSDAGSAARFFYCAKPSKAERERGCQGLCQEYDHSGPRGHTNNGDGTPREETLPMGNAHPTVKPLALMRYLVRLVTPPGGTVLDPFTGSGTTGLAAVTEGFPFIGIELNPDYLAIANARIAAITPPLL